MLPFPSLTDLSPPPELLPLLEGVLAQVAQVCRTPHAYLYTLSREGDALETVAVQGLFTDQLGFRIRRGQGLGGQVWESGESRSVPDYDRWEERIPNYPTGVLGAVLALPLKVHGQVVGVLGMAHPPGEGRFEQGDLERLRPLAELASLALENAGLRSNLMREWGEHRRAAQQLKLSRSRLDWHTNLVPLPLVELDLEGRVRRWNPVAEQTFGFLENEALGCVLSELIIEGQDFERAKAYWTQLLELSVDSKLVLECHTRGGQRLTCQWFSTPLLDEDGHLGGFACIVQDISHSRRAEERVRVLEAAAMLAQDAVVITRYFEGEHRIVYANAAFTQLTGYSFAEVSGLNPRFLHTGESDAGTLNSLEHSISEHNTSRAEVLETRKDGSHYWCEISLQPILNELGKPGELGKPTELEPGELKQVEYWVSWRRDISARKRAGALTQARGRLLEMLLRGAGVDATLLECARLLEGQWDARVVLTRLIENRFQAVAASGFPDTFLETLGSMDLGGPRSAWSRYALERGLVVSEDLGSDPKWSLFHPYVEALGIVSVWNWPIRSGGGQLLGSISVAFPERRLPDESDLALFLSGQQLAALCIEHGELEERLEQQTYLDALTGLPNRAAFEREFVWTLEHLSPQAPLALLLLDLDGFKAINDACGHEVGDALLRLVAEALRPEVGPHSLFRMGGDEYSLLVRALGEVELQQLAERLHRALDRSFFVGDLELFVSVSLGLVQRSPELQTRSSLLRAADTALYRAKASGRNLYVLYQPGMDVSQGRLELAVALRRALEKGEFELYYQVQVSPGGAAVGVEALLRWNRPEGVVPPAQFIPIAEETGLISPLGQWVLETACAQAMRWRESGLSVGMAVNVSALHFARPDFIATVQGVLERTGLPASALELELTESIFVGDLEHTAAQMQALRGLGVRLYLDDFGTGYSSLSYLRGLPLDGLKIDRSFVGDLEHTEGGLAGAIVGMARQLGLETVAEGVESALQLERLNKLGCERLQGFLFAGALPAKEVEALLRERRMRETPLE